MYASLEIHTYSYTKGATRARPERATRDAWHLKGPRVAWHLKGPRALRGLILSWPQARDDLRAGPI